MEIINEIQELFQNPKLFAKICSEVDLSKDIRILNNDNNFYVQGYMFEWFEMEFINDISIQEIFCHLWVRSIYFTEEWDLSVKISYKNFLELYIPMFLNPTTLGNHIVILKENSSKFFNEIYLYLPQVLELKKCIHNHYFRKNFEKVLIHNKEYNNFIDIYKHYDIIQLFDEYMGAIYFGTNGKTAFLCDMEFID